MTKIWFRLIHMVSARLEIATPCEDQLALVIPFFSLPVAGQVRLSEKLSEQHAICHVL